LLSRWNTKIYIVAFGVSNPEVLFVSSADNPFAASYGRAMGIDPAYGSSSFGIVITQLVDGQVQVL